MYERMDNGVRSRADGAGDAWAAAHRGLGTTYNMQDVDAMFGSVAFGSNTGEKVFLEYVPDNYSNRGKSIRQFRLVALFDRKTSDSAAFGYENSVSVAFYLWLCRTLAQEVSPKFFVVIGGQVPPWKMVELDIETGRPTGCEQIIYSADSNEWKTVWNTLGLHELRQSVAREFYAASRRK